MPENKGKPASLPQSRSTCTRVVSRRTTRLPSRSRPEDRRSVCACVGPLPVTWFSSFQVQPSTKPPLRLRLLLLLLDAKLRNHTPQRRVQSSCVRGKQSRKTSYSLALRKRRHVRGLCLCGPFQGPGTLSFFCGATTTNTTTQHTHTTKNDTNNNTQEESEDLHPLRCAMPHSCSPPSVSAVYEEPTSWIVDSEDILLQSSDSSSTATATVAAAGSQHLSSRFDSRLLC